MPGSCFFFKLINEIDLFGRRPDIYYKGNSKRKAWIGKVFTQMYALIYLAFFIYKLIRMIKKFDVTFYETSTYTGETPFIKLNNEIFYGGFALANPYTLQTFIDERIYYPVAFFISGIKEGNNWHFSSTSVEIEKCKLEKFGSKYIELFRDKNINNLYCFKEMNVTLEGHITYEKYSHFIIKFFPCVNSSSNNFNCLSQEEIESYLNYAYVSVLIQDIELTPENYDNPTKIRTKELTTPVYSNLYKNINSYFHIINVETDHDIIGLDVFENIRKDKYFKYDDTFIISSLTINNIFETGEALCDITIQLSEDIITLKRTKTKLIDAMGEIGGFMSITFSLFKMFSTFMSRTIYEISIVNNLFEFDLDNRQVLLKTDKNINIGKKLLKSEEAIKSYSSIKLLPKNTISIYNLYKNNQNSHNKNKIEEDSLTKKNLNIENQNINRPKNIQRRFTQGENNNINSKKDFNLNNSDIIRKNEKSKNAIEKRNFIDNIEVNKLFVCFCFFCIRKRKNIKNILIEEGIRMVKEKLDILYLFRKIFRDENFEDKFSMSDKCKQSLKEIKYDKFK